jgi:serine/threonine protein kinase/Tol biopolymer transport system component
LVHRPSDYVGQIIGNYRVIEKLGAGGMGVVYKAEDIRLGRLVAIKVLLNASLAEPQSLERFRREARAASSLNHPHICTVYEAGEDSGLPFLALELMEGETLAQKISGRPLALEVLLQLGMQICDGLGCAHEKGIVHRDVKPSNIFITRRGDAKLLDFGLSKVFQADCDKPEDITLTAAMTQDGQVLGTAPYMSPEQAQGQAVDHRSDIFSLGAVLYEMATGIRAFKGKAPAEILAEVLLGNPKPLNATNPQVPQELQRMIAKALEKEPADRYQSAMELKIDLRRLMKELPLLESGAPPTSYSRKEGLTGKWRSIGVALTAAGLAIALAVLLTPSRAFGPLDSQQLTFSSEPKEGPLFTDGARLYFTSGGGSSVMAVSGGTIAPLRNLQPGMRMLDLSPDGSQILALKIAANNEIGLGSLWTVPTLGGTPRRLGNDLALTARWSPDGRSLAYANKRKLYISGSDGANAREIWTGPGYLTDLCFSPDSREIAATAATVRFSHLWTMQADGRDAHQLRLDWPDNTNQMSAQWTPDGLHFLFMSDREGRVNIYEVIAPRWYEFWKSASSVRLTGNQLDIQGVAPARAGGALFALGRLQQGAMQVFDLRTKSFRTYLGGLPATDFVISPDREWIAYTEYPSGYLWKSRLDGSEKLQLTHSIAAMEQWSPDSKSLVFTDWFKLYRVSADGGIPETLISGNEDSQQEVAPSWSRDGASIFFNYFPYPDRPLQGVQVLDLASRKISTMPGSQGLYVPLWSPNGKYLVAIGQSPSRLMLYSSETKTWSALKRFNVEWNWFVWTNDSRYLYISLTEGENGLYRLSVPEGKWEKLSNLDLPLPREPLAGFINVTPEGYPAIMRDTGIAQIYSLSWK